MSADYYDRAGRPMTFDEWRVAWEDESARRVDETFVGDVRVSTIWLGLDHRFGFSLGRGLRPLIFETMIFGGDFDGEQYRTSTEDEARNAHEIAVALVSE